MKLLLDEHLSPRLALWCAERRGIYAVPVAHVGLAGRSDAAIWNYAFAHDFSVVTTNVRDFIALLRVDLHPGLIVLRESGLTRAEQWERLEIALDHLRRQADPADYMVNRMIEILAPSQLLVRMIARHTE